MNINNLSSSNFQKEIASGLHLIDFWAEWCGPCRAMNPILEQFNNANPFALKVSKVNVDHENTLSSKLGVTSIPTMILFQDGVEVGRIVGAMPVQVLEDKVRQILLKG